MSHAYEDTCYLPPPALQRRNELGPMGARAEQRPNTWDGGYLRHDAALVEGGEPPGRGLGGAPGVGIEEEEEGVEEQGLDEEAQPHGGDAVAAQVQETEVAQAPGPEKGACCCFCCC